MLATYGVSDAFSPALYPGSTRVWLRAGFEEVNRLGIMERSLARPTEPAVGVFEEADVDWPALESVDKQAFEGFWRMSVEGLVEAVEATSKSAVLARRESGRLAGYAIVGTQTGVSYLQRIGVHPDYRGNGFGRQLVRAAISWARSTPSTVMVLNVRDENTPARSLYTREGFTATGTHLRMLRRPV